MSFAKQRLFLTADGEALVAEGDERGATLYAAPEDEIPDSAAAKFGLVDGDLPKEKPLTAKQKAAAEKAEADKAAAEKAEADRAAAEKAEADKAAAEKAEADKAAAEKAQGN
jgi:membrane protein involved in colicin uptake